MNAAVSPAAIVFSKITGQRLLSPDAAGRMYYFIYSIGYNPFFNFPLRRVYEVHIPMG